MLINGGTRMVIVVSVLAACAADDSPMMTTDGLSSIALGTAQSCRLDTDGTARCWGELGLAGATTIAPAPVAVAGTLRFEQLTAYGKMVCGVSADSVASCWGPNDRGQLGLGTIDAGSATPVTVGTSRPFSKIVAGDATSCGINPMGQGLCWGANALGQVGADVGPTDVQSPLPLAGALVMREISVSRDFACGITTAGAAYCWGSNANGQLGGGGAITGQAGDLKRAPQAVIGGHSWRAITTGDQFACGITTAGAAFCWGSGGSGQLGTGATTASSTPAAVAGGHVFTSLDAGRDFTCGTTQSESYCWGANTYGQLGNGDASPASSTMPVVVAGAISFAELRASDGDHVCGISSERTAVYCWGRNELGQLGIGAASNTRTATPTLVTQ
ncbi:MAG: hypothetical protein H0T89_07790 [Deltaproteobacteria bacterium]|nr:hypothetical protein [Deltaproteobacteria bacterium]MDQ3297040.1 hypothetical protein [Myxococcota bacterium]